MIRVGLYRPVHVKTLRSQKLRMLLTHRKLLQSKAIAVENDLRGTLRNFGLKVGIAGGAKFEALVRELVEGVPIWPCWSNHCSWSGGYCVSRLMSCTAACWPSSGTAALRLAKSPQLSEGPNRGEPRTGYQETLRQLRR